MLTGSVPLPSTIPFLYTCHSPVLDDHVAHTWCQWPSLVDKLVTLSFKKKETHVNS